MKSYKLFLLGLITMTTTAHAQQPSPESRRPSTDQIRSVAPALEQYTQDRLYGDVWKRPGLSPRDRSLVTVAALVARSDMGALAYYADQALENGVKPAEISETITHLAYYSGWGKAMAAIAPVSEVFGKRGIGAEQLPKTNPTPLPLDEKTEAARATNVGNQFGNVAPGLVQYTTDYLFRDLWLRPDLAPRDRSLVTVTGLISSGQVEQIIYHHQPRDGQWTDRGRGRRSNYPSRLLRGLAERHVCVAGRKGNFRKAA